MRFWLDKIRYTLGRWMYGRYGMDTLSRHLNVLAIALLLLSLLVPLLYPFALAAMVWSTFRIYSKNIPARTRERDGYARWLSKLQRRHRLMKSRFRDRKTHRFYKCPGCKEYLRVPKGRGEVHITCPGCRTEIVRRT